MTNSDNVNVKRRRARRVICALVAVAALVASVTACSSYAPPDMIGLYYTGGVGEAQAFKECIEPSTSGSYPVDDSTYWLPTSLRTWTIAPNGGDSHDPITTGSKPTQALGANRQPTGETQPGPEMNVWVTATFYLNTDCAQGHDSPIVQFWEKTGKRPWKDGHGIAENGEDGAGFNEGAWEDMLRNTLVQALAKSIRQESRNYFANDIDSNNFNVWTLMERQLGPSFNQALHDAVGGDYFCGPQYQRGHDVDWTTYVPDGVDDAGLPKFREQSQRGKCPPLQISITDAGFTNPKIAEGRADVFAAEQRAQAALIDAQSKADTAAKLNQIQDGAVYVELERIKAQLAAAEACKANPNCTVIIDGSGSSGVTVGRK